MRARFAEGKQAVLRADEPARAAKIRIDQPQGVLPVALTGQRCADRGVSERIENCGHATF